MNKQEILEKIKSDNYFDKCLEEFTCPTCGGDLFGRHKIIDHTMINYFICTDCDFKCDQKITVIEEENKVINERDSACMNDDNYKTLKRCYKLLEDMLDEMKRALLSINN